MKKIMMITDTCDNCGDCVKSCMEVHGISRISILEHDDKYLPIVCQHCASAPCKEVCPVDAIEFRGDIVYLDEDVCIGCGLCAMACPFGAIVVSDKAHKCTLCIGRDEQACVKACTKRCLDVVGVEDLIFDKRSKNLETMAKLSPNKELKKESKKNFISKLLVSAKTRP